MLDNLELHGSPPDVLADIRTADSQEFDDFNRRVHHPIELRVIVTTGSGDVVTVVRAVKLGEPDTTEKPSDETMLLELLNRHFATLPSLLEEDRLNSLARQKIESLTIRETEVLRGLLSGKPNKVLAFELGLSTRTVEMHRASMLNHLNVRTLPEALQVAFRAGLRPVSTVDDRQPTRLP